MTVDKNTINCYLLGKSRLLPGTKASGPAEALDALAVLDAGNLPGAYYSLFLRSGQFDVSGFSRSLQAGTGMARLPGLKGATQIIPRDLMQAVYAVSARERETRADSALKGWKIDAEEYARVRDAINEGLGDKEKTLPQLKNGLKPGLSRDIVRVRGKRKERSTNVAVVASVMRERWELLRGGIGRVPGEDPGRFSRFSKRFGNMRLDMDYREALKKLSDRYIKAYGPVSAEDLGWWLGLPVKEVAAYIDKTKVAKVEIAGMAGDFFTGRDEDIACDRDLSSTVHMLPAEDPYVKAYARRERFVPGTFLDRIITRFGESESVVLIDGVAAGIWGIEHEPDGDVCNVEMFGKEAAVGRESAIESAAEAAAIFFAGEKIPVCMSVYKK